MIQSIQSYNKQQAGFGIACDKMSKYLGASLTMVKSFCILGGPGVGKTALMKMILLKAISLGLNSVLMTLMLEWAFQLGGIHLHKLLLLPVHEKGTVQHLAELAIISIYKSPEAMLTLIKLDVPFINELGQ
jgi:adenylate kinase